MNASVLVRALDKQTKNKVLGSGIAASLLAVSLVVTLGFYGGVFDPTTPFSPNDLVFTINNTVANDFADFVPYDESFTPDAPVYTISSDLSVAGKTYLSIMFSSLSEGSIKWVFIGYLI